MIEYKPSSTFHAEQGLTSDTVIDSDLETLFMFEFISLIVGAPIKAFTFVDEMKVDVKRVVIWNLNVTNETTG